MARFGIGILLRIHTPSMDEALQNDLVRVASDSSEAPAACQTPDCNYLASGPGQTFCCHKCRLGQGHGKRCKAVLVGSAAEEAQPRFLLGQSVLAPMPGSSNMHLVVVEHVNDDGSYHLK